MTTISYIFMKRPKSSNSTFRYKWSGIMKLKCVIMLLIGMLLFLPMGVLAQNGGNASTVTGVVTGMGEPLIGVTVSSSIEKVVTDLDGRYSIKVIANGSLTFNYVGYVQAIVNVNGRHIVDVDLKEENYSLNDVVVVGYGNQKKINLTGAVSSISTKELQNKPISNVIEGLQGSSPGLVIQEGTSAPGSVPSVNIRGLNTMNNNNK